MHNKSIALLCQTKFPYFYTTYLLIQHWDFSCGGIISSEEYKNHSPNELSTVIAIFWLKMRTTQREVYKKCLKFIRTIGQHLDNLMKWLVRMGNTGVWGNDPGICKRKKDGNKKSCIFSNCGNLW